jgi:hypothetical protein
MGLKVESSLLRDLTAHSYVLSILRPDAEEGTMAKLRKIEFSVTTPYNDDINKRVRNPEAANVKGYVHRICAPTRQA